MLQINPSRSVWVQHSEGERAFHRLAKPSGLVWKLVGKTPPAGSVPLVEPQYSVCGSNILDALQALAP